MGPAIVTKKRLGVRVESSCYKSNDVFAKELEENLMKSTTLSQDSKVDEHVIDERTEEVRGKADVKVDIMGCKRFGANELVEVARQETTESSSSFDGSGSEDDSDAMSNFRGDAESAPGIDGLHNTFRTRQKKLTSHWSSYIQPLRWRCKWVELQIQKLASQAQKYDRGLQEYRQQRHIQFENTSSESVCMKLLSAPQKNARNDVLRRKKRKRMEETTEISTYMSNHNLFSYYENRKSFAEGVSMDKLKSPVAKTTQQVVIDDVRNEPLLLEDEDDNDPWELLLRKIFRAQSEVRSLKGRLNKVITENGLDLTENKEVPLPSVDLLGNIAVPNNGDVPVPQSGNLVHSADALAPGEVIGSTKGKEEMNTDERVKTTEPEIHRQKKLKREIDAFDEVALVLNVDGIGGTTTTTTPVSEELLKVGPVARLNTTSGSTSKRGSGKD